MIAFVHHRSFNKSQFCGFSVVQMWFLVIWRETFDRAEKKSVSRPVQNGRPSEVLCLCLSITSLWRTLCVKNSSWKVCQRGTKMDVKAIWRKTISFVDAQCLPVSLLRTYFTHRGLTLWYKHRLPWFRAAGQHAGLGMLSLSQKDPQKSKNS